MRPPTPEEAFRMGAESMRSEIAVRLLTKGGAGAIMAPHVLSMPLPRFQIPEIVVIEEPK